MTLRKTEIIEWSTTPAELRRIAEQMEKQCLADFFHTVCLIQDKNMELSIVADQGQWQAEQAEGKE